MKRSKQYYYTQAHRDEVSAWVAANGEIPLIQEQASAVLFEKEVRKHAKESSWAQGAGSMAPDERVAAMRTRSWDKYCENLKQGMSQKDACLIALGVYHYPRHMTGGWN